MKDNLPRLDKMIRDDRMPVSASQQLYWRKTKMPVITGPFPYPGYEMLNKPISFKVELPK